MRTAQFRPIAFNDIRKGKFFKAKGGYCTYLKVRCPIRGRYMGASLNSGCLRSFDPRDHVVSITLSRKVLFVTREKLMVCRKDAATGT
jgi:hypothetical protein